MVTLTGTQNLNEFELHLRTILGLPISIQQFRAGASAVVLADSETEIKPEYSGVEDALSLKNTDVRIFGKPFTRKNRRMAVALTYTTENEDIQTLRDRAIKAASLIKIVEKQ
jgi:phosphoribosylglycinamide formyltransferase 2